MYLYTTISLCKHICLNGFNDITVIDGDSSLLQVLRPAIARGAWLQHRLYLPQPISANMLVWIMSIISSSLTLAAPFFRFSVLRKTRNFCSVAKSKFLKDLHVQVTMSYLSDSDRGMWIETVRCEPTGRWIKTFIKWQHLLGFNIDSRIFKTQNTHEDHKSYTYS